MLARAKRLRHRKLPLLQLTSRIYLQLAAAVSIVLCERDLAAPAAERNARQNSLGNLITPAGKPCLHIITQQMLLAVLSGGLVHSRPIYKTDITHCIPSEEVGFHTGADFTGQTSRRLLPHIPLCLVCPVSSRRHRRPPSTRP